MSYGAFAEFYDTLTENVDYAEIAAYYDRLNTRFGGKKEILLDLACGTGSLSVLFSKMGYDVIGVDSSPEMLNVALSKEHGAIQYLCQSMTELDLYGTIQAAVSSLDSINHLSDRGEVLRAFERVSLFSDPGALFLFDVNTVYKHERVLEDRTFLYEAEHVLCIWQNEYLGDGTTEIALDFFAEGEDGRYERFSEGFTETAYPEEELHALLERAGFEVCAVYDYLTEEPPRADSEKLTFVARKREGSGKERE
ncbi:MAG: methyltransferase domain-containing protein [Bacteroides sp.]|nr:methyltransferase domain-containing protein [Eubacterium sp.]MCM1418284.1 methyltransferase domain-containing protein [Roseburia sp.]MCM1462387.1 methyltransferase domain-containing protein [Bacteroides sp.]